MNMRYAIYPGGSEDTRDPVALCCTEEQAQLIAQLWGWQGYWIPLDKSNLEKPVFCQCREDWTDGTAYCQQCGLEREWLSSNQSNSEALVTIIELLTNEFNRTLPDYGPTDVQNMIQLLGAYAQRGRNGATNESHSPTGKLSRNPSQ